MLNYDYLYFNDFIKDINRPKLTLNKANTDNENASFLDLDLFMNNYSVTTKIYVKRDEFSLK